ncbi:MAG: bifunctional 23S rRNA (guanine(2069)-N(7))-methyltransferase RlmK/23S rRNA (guanine(2445)-N(2))-methyltransferase RlmL [Myxococcota bacterium]
MPSDPFVAIAAAGTEGPLGEELRALGLEPQEGARGAVPFRGPGAFLEAGYRAALHSRIANRVLLPLLRFPIPEDERDAAEVLYAKARSLDWTAHLDAGGTLAVEAVAGRERRAHTRFLALRTKDAVVDALRDARGFRPDVDVRTPDLPLHLHWGAQEATLSIDVLGVPLHRRGYRPKGAAAPLRETLAAAILRLSGWSAKDAAPLVDPMCGSGTFLVEAALMLRRVAPQGRTRLRGWAGHDRALWSRLVREAEAEAADARGAPLPLHGFDRDPAAARATRAALAAVGASDVPVEVRPLRELQAPAGPPGHVVVNPPYGERLGEAGEVLRLYADLGDVLKQRFGGWQAHVLSANEEALARVGLRPSRKDRLFNGPLACRLDHFPLRAPKGDGGPRWRKARPEAEMLTNRLRKNRKRLGKWARKERLDSWRLYDGDVPEYHLAVDLHGDAAVIQEYRRSGRADAKLADARLQDALLVVPEVLGLAPEDVHLRVRSRSASPTEKRSAEGTRRPVREGPFTFEVNLTDYLDVGLFPDHRDLRARLGAEAAPGTAFLNLFAYTCSASVYAAAAGARTTSVDLSNTYLSWGEDHFRRNDLDPGAHRFVRSDARRFLEGCRERFALAFVAPPSFSRSKAAPDFTIQEDHGALLYAVHEVLTPGGVCWFSTHARGFVLDAGLARRFHVESVDTVPRDYTRSPHVTWRLVRKR